MSAPPHFSQSSCSIATFSLFGFPKGTRFWAFRQMGTMPLQLSKTPGLKFWKLLGAGHGQGFSLKPDFGRYGLFAVWETRIAAENFLKNSLFIESYNEKAYESWHVYLGHISSHGNWAGQNPFEEGIANAANFSEIKGAPVAVLTRASIRTSKLRSFWKHVPETSNAIAMATGLISSIGVGEWPVVRQATFSFWKTMNDAKDFAYKNKVHQNVIEKTRKEKWYKEEMFARFIVLNSSGKWHGKNPLEEFEHHF